MNFAAIVGSLLRSGYALPTQRPDNGALQNQLADDPLIESEMLSRLSRPPLCGVIGAACYIIAYFATIKGWLKADGDTVRIDVQKLSWLKWPWHAGDVQRHQPCGEGAHHDQAAS